MPRSSPRYHSNTRWGIKKTSSSWKSISKSCRRCRSKPRSPTQVPKEAVSWELSALSPRQPRKGRRWRAKPTLVSCIRGSLQTLRRCTLEARPKNQPPTITCGPVISTTTSRLHSTRPNRKSSTPKTEGWTRLFPTKWWRKNAERLLKWQYWKKKPCKCKKKARRAAADSSQISSAARRNKSTNLSPSKKARRWPPKRPKNKKPTTPTKTRCNSKITWCKRTTNSDPHDYHSIHYLTHPITTSYIIFVCAYILMGN